MLDKKKHGIILFTVCIHMISYLKGIPAYPGVISFKTGTAQFLGSFAGLDPPATNGGFSVFDDRNIREF